MANRQLFWQGSTAQDISSFDFSVASNWKEYKYLNGKYGVYTTTTPPENLDTVYIGSSYVPAFGITAAKSPCLFGGFSGNSAGGTWYIGGAAGTTFTSSLHVAYVSSTSNNSGQYNVNYYNFPYLGTGLTNASQDWVTSNWWTGATAGIQEQIDVYTKDVTTPLTLKTAWIDISSLGVAGSSVVVNCVKSLGSSYGATGATSAFYITTGARIFYGGKRSGTLQLNGGSLKSVDIIASQGYPNSNVNGHNQSSEQFNFIGVTAGDIRLQGSPNAYFDENCNVGNMVVGSGYWQGPILFGGKLSRRVYDEIFTGLTGATGGTGASSLGSLTISPLVNSATIGIGGFGTSTVAPYNTPTNTAKKTPILYFGGRSSVAVDGVVSTANSINVSSSAGVSGSLATARWNVQFAGSVGVSGAYATDAVFSAAPIYVYDENSPDISKTPEISSEDKISINSMYLTKYAILDLSATPDFNGWSFGYLSGGSLLGGIYFNDETSTVRGSKDMRLVNDTVLAGGRWSQRLSVGAQVDVVGPRGS